MPLYFHLSMAFCLFWLPLFSTATLAAISPFPQYQLEQPDVHIVDRQFVVRQWETRDGLPQNSVTAIAQTRDGYLWLGTFNGLVRFDGIRFTVFTIGNTPELRSDYITALLVDAGGILWIATNGGGLVRYRPAPEAKAGFSPVTTEEGLGELDIAFLLLDPAGRICAASMDNFYGYDGAKFRPIVFPAQEPLVFRGFAFDPSGQLWASTSRGTRAIASGLLHPFGPADRPTHRITLDSENTLWSFDEKDGLLRLEPNPWPVSAAGSARPDAGQPRVRQFKFLRQSPEVIYAAPKGRVWFGGNKNPLTYFENGRFFQFAQPGLLDQYDVTAIFEDRNQNIWVGLDGAGLVRLRPKEVVTFSAEDGLPSNNCVTIAEDRDGRIWAGLIGARGGLSWILPETKQIHPGPADFQDKWVSSILRGADGMWIGLYGWGLFSWAQGRAQRHESGPGPHGPAEGFIIRALFQDSTGAFWIGTHNQGLHYFESGSSHHGIGEGRSRGPGAPRMLTTENGLPHDKVTAIAEDKDKRIWVGTADGLCLLETFGKISQYGRAHGLGAPAIHALFVDRAGDLWVGTAGGGLSRFRNNRFQTIASRHGLPNDVVGQILEDDQGDIWVGTNRGIARLPREPLEKCLAGETSFINPIAYGQSEGMLSEECGGSFQPASCRDQRGRLWFATVGGLVMIDPTARPLQGHPPEVYLEEVWGDFTPVLAAVPGSPAPPLRFPSSIKNIEIRYTGIDLTAPEKVRFRYRLEPFEESWVEAGSRRRAFYTALPPGQYTFRVIAANNRGAWNYDGAALHLAILPAWWQTTLFRLAVAGVLATSLALLYQARVRHFKREQLRKIEFSRRLIQSQETERARIARELHDSLGQSLLVIKNRAFLALEQAGPLPALQNHLQEICEVSGEAIQEARHISHALRPPQLDRLGLTRALEGLARQVAESGDLQLHSQVAELDEAFPPGDQINVLRILQEAFNNILKHSKASSITLRAERHPSHVLIQIADDGCGFNLAETNTGLGLLTMEERVKLLRGDLQIQTAPGCGARLTISLPTPSHATA